jgi:hypothetical protein
MSLDPLDALTELVDFGLHRPRLFELASRPRGRQRLIDDHGERDDPLRTVDAGHHPGRYASAAVPRAQAGAGHACGPHGLFEGDPPLFDGLAGKVAEEAVPLVPGGLVAVSAHGAITTEAAPRSPTLTSDRDLTWSVC